MENFIGKAEVLMEALPYFQRFYGKTLVDAAVHLPLVLPPVAVGFALLVLFGKQGLIGSKLDEWFGIVFAFRWTGAALASAVMGFPLMVRAIRLAFQAVDPRLEMAARSLGAGRLHSCTHSGFTVSSTRSTCRASMACLPTISRQASITGCTTKPLG